MVNITYGVLSAPDGTVAGSSNTLPLGTDIIVTYGPNNDMVASYSPGDISWVLTCTALVWLMIPGLGYLYSGLARRKNALHLLLLTLAALAVVSFQWFFWGYSLAFSQTSGAFLGNLRNFGYMGVLENPVPQAYNKVPEIVYAIYQCMFANLVPAIAIGAACERGRVWPFLIFTFVWTTLVYDVIACWVWNPTGWAFKWGVLDYAGGGPVEINSGITGLVISYYLGPRHGYGTERLLFKPHNVSYIFLGTAFLWFGWLGFNGGSVFAANLRAAMAISTTNLAASGAGLTWMFLDWRLERKWSVVGFCTGAIAGLVAITPAAGFVGMPAGLLIGVVAAAASNFATVLKGPMRVDDVMDIFSVHALAGIVGTLMTGIFTQASVANNDGNTVITGGWLDGNWIQLAYQLAYCVAVTSWCGGVTFAIMFVIDHTPFIGPFRSSEMGEVVGMDEDQCGEWAYDYAFINRDLEGNYNPTHGQKLDINEKMPNVHHTSSLGSDSTPDQSSNVLADKQAASRGNAHAQDAEVATPTEVEQMKEAAHTS
ncbi:Ammonium transporter AmtB-like domain protein [Kalmanozyma brasiliensis GHG001]|uniref:Ammonium transporter n=1 Tax=Kalmanozyma brasiliensis (strain GHG001) TaxID=1365824 RepID=V5ETX5_KALBG|nr:Ammonium transporter AmtB-like domain protein [Kalmanozyma brasiliensis GHG001]EST08770.1 Ammonium transporter AmtB-like domain protein [Kalmanozyma brasiliensis GHG001]